MAEDRAVRVPRHWLLFSVAVLAGCGSAATKLGPVAQHRLRNGPIAFERAAGERDPEELALHSGHIATLRPAGRQIYLRSTDGAVRRLTHLGGGAGSPAWSPDGSRIAFVRGRAPQADEIWTMGADGSGARAVTSGCTRRCHSDAAPTWSPDGRQIVFERAYGPILRHVDIACPGCYVELPSRIDLLRVPAAGGAATLVKRWGSDPQPWAGAPTWSPDGSRLAVPIVTFKHPNKHTSLGTALFVLNADGSGARRITPWDIGAANPDWSPDGRWIVANSAGGHSANIGVVHPDGSGLHQIYAANQGRAGAVFLGQGVDPAWSPDGRQIVFESETNPCNSGSAACDRAIPQFDIYAMSADGSDLRRLTSAPQYEAGPAWGPASP
jgi:TolB protein